MSNRRTICDLTSARELIRKGWTQRTSARDVDGMATRLSGKPPCSFCALGAISQACKQHAANVSSAVRYSKAFSSLARAIGSTDIPFWNDRPYRTQAEVIAAFDKAIAILNGETANVAS